MRKPFRRALFIFRRDLRLQDNTGLLFSLKNADEVIPCFIFTPEQTGRNPYKSNHCLQFMIESLEDLEHQLKQKQGKLFLFYGASEKIVKRCIENLSIDVVVVNRDYTPYSCQRDQKICSVCKKRKVNFHSFEDLLLQPVEETLKKDGTPYTIFTPFYRNASKLEVTLPRPNPYKNYYSGVIRFAKDSALYRKILSRRIEQRKGGRKSALTILKNLRKFSDYKVSSDFPEKNGTTHLSAHLKFTTCSPREVYHALVRLEYSDIIRSLYWRDFFTMIGFYFPQIFKEAFHKRFDRISWSYKKENYKKWCEGKTGFPIVDAGMRELNQTGFMHNRVRMIVASFLVKDLHIDWRWGEKFFAQKLIDYDPSVNNGNWQWCASTGCDAQPYFRVFNPWSQQMKFDPECKYIKHWVPELSSVSCKLIHEWHLQKSQDPSIEYPVPMINHAIEAKKALESYRKVANR